MHDVLELARQNILYVDHVEFYTLRAPAAATARANEPHDRIFHVDARFESAGVWAGVSDLVEMAYQGLHDLGAESLLAEHLLALHAVLPAYRDRLHPDHMCLTDTAADAEKTRYHPLNRAYRFIHDLVGLIFDWKQQADASGRWAVVVWNFDRGQHLGVRFFAELARRSASRHGIDIIVATQPDWSDSFLHNYGLCKVATGSWDSTQAASPTANARLAAEMEQAIAEGHPALLEQCHARLIAYYQSAGDDVAAARIALKTCFLYTNLGYYHEARQMIDVFMPFWARLIGDDEEQCAYAVSKMSICMVVADDPDGALRVLEDLGASRLTRPHLLANVNYSLGMHYLRYAHAKDLSRAEDHLLRAAELNRKTDGASLDPFKKVFFENGLAFLRVRQGRAQEALDLCQAGYAYLTGELGESRHCLHRSVLQYNMAQLHAMLGNLDAALEHYHHAIRMDPHYSEYYNEAGNIYQEQERYPEAIAFYEKAIRRSAPYPEVFYNKAVCHMRQEEWREALICFDTTLELHPAQPQACALRADLLRELGRPREALEGYDAAIMLGNVSAAVRVNRAVLYYDDGLFDLALADMEQAIALEPDEPSHYENRAAIYRALDVEDLCLRDTRAAERCRELA